MLADDDLESLGHNSTEYLHLLFEENKLASADPGFTPMAKNFVQMQVNGISANPDIPVHPGLVKFLKEQKAWNDKWKVAAGS